MTEEEFSDWLIDEMDRRNLTIRKLSEISGLSKMALTYYITGRSVPRMDSFVLLLKAFGKELRIVDKE